MKNNEHEQKLLKYILSPEIFEYFDIVELQEKEKILHIYLDEQAVLPAEYASHKLISKGFHQPVEIKDFPLRNKAVLLEVRRRRWLDKDTGEIVSRDWNLVAEGTHYTQGFASFLKGIIGYLPDCKPIT